MKLAIVGTGYVGLTTGICLSDVGHNVICVDNDPKATEIAAQNAVINAVDHRLHILNKDAAQITQPRNLIIANLTAKLLLKLHAQLVRLLLPDGYLIISGIIETDIPSIEEHFIVAPLEVQNMLTEKEWVCYVLKMNRAAAAS